MINAERARSMASLPNEMNTLDGLITRAANGGKAGVWIWDVSDFARESLRKHGFETTSGSLNCEGVDRTGFTWIWWG